MLVSTARSLSDVEHIRSDWRRLGSQSEQDNPNVDYDHYLCVLQSLPAAVSPHVVSIGRDTSAEVMLIGRVDRARLNLQVGYKGLFGIDVKTLQILHGGVLGRWTSETASQVLISIRESLSTHQYDLVQFNMIPAETPLIESIPDVFPWWQMDRLPIKTIHHQLRLPESMEAFYETKSKKHRANLRNYKRRVDAGKFGTATVRCYRNLSEIDELFAVTERIAKASYQRGLGVGFMNDASTRLQLSLGARKGWLRSYVLYLDSEPVAFQLGIQYRNGFFVRGKAYDPKFAHIRPGQYLFQYMLEEFTEEGAIELWDFGIGDAAYKRELSNTSWEEVSTVVFAPGIKGILLNCVYTSIRKIDAFGRGLVEGLGWADRLKKLWRRKRTARLQPM